MKSAFLFVLTLGCLAGCGPLLSGSATPADPPEAVLKTYAVPQGSADRLVESLNRAFGRETNVVMRATVGPGGVVMVVAPDMVQRGVGEMVQTLDATPAPAPRNVELTYWMVRGVAGAEADGPGLDAVKSTLEALEQIDGPMAFTLLGVRRLVTIDGRQGEIKDRFEVHQLVSITGGETLLADLEVSVPGAAHPETRVALSAGKTTVLAQAGAMDEGGQSGQLYVLVRPQLP